MPTWRRLMAPLAAGSIYGGAGKDTLAFAGAVTSGATTGGLDQGGFGSLTAFTLVPASQGRLSLVAPDTFYARCDDRCLWCSCNWLLAQVSFGSNADMATFSGAVGDSLVFDLWRWRS